MLLEVRSLLSHHANRIEVVEPAMAAVLRQKTEAERLRIAWGMWKSAGDMLRALLRAQHGDWGAAQVESEVARRLSHGTG
jgi:hypothetical protein